MRQGLPGAGDARMARAHRHALLFHTAKESQRRAAADYRLHPYNITYVALADAAPTIGITTLVAVKDPLDYQRIEGLTGVPVPTAA
jgi:hypothetical protein